MLIPLCKESSNVYVRMSHFILVSVSCGDNSIAHEVKMMFLGKQHIITN